MQQQMLFNKNHCFYDIFSAFNLPKLDKIKEKTVQLDPVMILFTSLFRSPGWHNLHAKYAVRDSVWAVYVYDYGKRQSNGGWSIDNKPAT